MEHRFLLLVLALCACRSEGNSAAERPTRLAAAPVDVNDASTSDSAITSVVQDLVTRGPVIERRDDTYELVVPPPFMRAILNAVPGFSFWTLADYSPDVQRYYRFTMREVPWAVVGDFNGDGYTDLVAEGHTSTKTYRLCIFGDRSEPEVLTLKSAPRPSSGTELWIVLQFVGPGRIRTNYNYETLDLFTDAFEVYFFEKAATLYYWEDGSFKEFSTAD